MTTTVSVADILRPLAEGKVECGAGTGIHTEGLLCPVRICDGSGKVPDWRFDGLRAHVHKVGPGGMPGCGPGWCEGFSGIDASLGAIVDAARVSGREVFMAVVKALFSCYDSGEDVAQAAARALVAAVKVDG